VFETGLRANDVTPLAASTGRCAPAAHALFELDDAVEQLARQHGPGEVKP